MSIRIPLTVNTLKAASVIGAAAGTLTRVSEPDSYQLPPMSSTAEQTAGADGVKFPKTIGDLTAHDLVDKWRELLAVDLASLESDDKRGFLKTLNNVCDVSFLDFLWVHEEPSVFESMRKLDRWGLELFYHLRVSDFFRKLDIPQGSDLLSLGDLANDLLTVGNYTNGHPELIGLYIDLYRKMNPGAQDNELRNILMVLSRKIYEDARAFFHANPGSRGPSERSRLANLYSRLNEVLLGDGAYQDDLDLSDVTPRELPGSSEYCDGHYREAAQPDYHHSPYQTLIDEGMADACATLLGAADPVAMDRRGITDAARVASPEDGNEKNGEKNKGPRDDSRDQRVVVAGLLPPDWTSKTKDVADGGDDDQAVSPRTTPQKTANDNNREFLESMMRVGGVDEGRDENGGHSTAPLGLMAADCTLEDGNTDEKDGNNDGNGDDLGPFLKWRAITDANDRKWIASLKRCVADTQMRHSGQVSDEPHASQSQSTALHAEFAAANKTIDELRWAKTMTTTTTASNEADDDDYVAQVKRDALEVELAAAKDTIAELHRTVTDLRGAARDTTAPLMADMDAFHAELAAAQTEISAAQRQMAGGVVRLAGKPFVNLAFVLEKEEELAKARREIDSLRSSLETVRVAHVGLIEACRRAEREKEEAERVKEEAEDL